MQELTAPANPERDTDVPSDETQTGLNAQKYTKALWPFFPAARQNGYDKQENQQRSRRHSEFP